MTVNRRAHAMQSQHTLERRRDVADNCRMYAQTNFSSQARFKLAHAGDEASTPTDDDQIILQDTILNVSVICLSRCLRGVE